MANLKVGLAARCFIKLRSHTQNAEAACIRILPSTAINTSHRYCKANHGMMFLPYDIECDGGAAGRVIGNYDAPSVWAQ